ncbi:unnamed protein product, partial [Polarella glacialis]
VANQVGSVQGELERGLGSTQTSIKDVRNELLRALDTQAQVSANSILSQGQQSSNEVASLRCDLETLGTEQSRFDRSGPAQEERVELRMRDLREDLTGAVTKQAEKLWGLREALQQEMKSGLAQAELRSTHRADVDSGKFAALERSFVNLRVEASAIASQQQQHQPGGRGRSSEATDGPQDAQTPAMMTSGPRALSFAE